jgi:hypothetical protein
MIAVIFGIIVGSLIQYTNKDAYCRQENYKIEYCQDLKKLNEFSRK